MSYGESKPAALGLPAAPVSVLGKILGAYADPLTWGAAFYILNQAGAVIGAICTHIYLCYVYSKSTSIFVPSIAHIALDNAARSLSYFVVLQDQFAANLAQNLVFVIIVLILHFSKELSQLTTGGGQPAAVPASDHP